MHKEVKYPLKRRLPCIIETFAWEHIAPPYGYHPARDAMGVREYNLRDRAFQWIDRQFRLEQFLEWQSEEIQKTESYRRFMEGVRLRRMVFDECVGADQLITMELDTKPP